MHWLEVEWSLWKIVIPTLCNGLLSLACYVVGWHLSTAASPMPFTRAGALATAIAIGFTLYNYHEIIENSERAASEAIAKVTSRLPLTGEVTQRRIVRQLKRNSLRVTRVVTVLQAIILILATLVWGFGDLAACRMKETTNSATNSRPP